MQTGVEDYDHLGFALLFKHQCDYYHREWGPKQYTPISVQEWQDSQIIREKF
ncbi:hypothetical protein GCM10023187_32450 [Nibrella viscosa]|uniref:Uncharacterized protein n=1 Tax=Nibrella viscosa TaxID=1084524 RepID=A0ABP8KLH1_9BACT